jgi:hypothetical protein
VRRKALVAAPVVLALSFVACSLVENVDDYSNGPTDSSVNGSDSGDASDGAPIDTGVDTGVDTASDVADTTPGDSVVVDSTPADSIPTDSVVADTKVDSGVDAVAPDADAAPIDSGVDTGLDTGVDAGAPYRRTIGIDGVNDFLASEKFATTTGAGFDAYVTWDASALYVGYVGADIGASATTNKWVFVYLDVDASAATGAAKTAQYTNQQHVLPAGFGADAYFAWKTDGSYSELKKYAGGVWSSVASPGVTFNRNATSSYVEMKIPFTSIAAAVPAKLGVVTFMLNEASGLEWTWAGLWSASFTDGYSPAATPKTIGSYLLVDLASPLAPNTSTNKKP